MVYEAFHWLYQEIGWPREALPGTIIQRWNWSFYANSPCYKAEERRVNQNICEEISEYGTLMSELHKQSTLVETCRYNLQTTLLAQIEVAECRIWKQLVLQGEQAEKIITRVKAEEKDNKLRPDKSTRRAPESLSQPRRRDTLATEVKSPSKPKLTRGNSSAE